MVWRNLAVGGKYAEGDRQVVGGAFFAYIGGSHVDYHLFTWELISALAYCRCDTLGALFNCRVGETDHYELYARVGEHLDGDWDCVDALEGRADCLYEHCGWISLVRDVFACRRDGGAAVDYAAGGISDDEPGDGGNGNLLESLQVIG